MDADKHGLSAKPCKLTAHLGYTGVRQRVCKCPPGKRGVKTKEETQKRNVF